MTREITTADVKRDKGGLWAKGSSPNPGGRPKKLAEIEDMLDREHRTVGNLRAVFARLKALALGEVVIVIDPRGGTAHVELTADPAFMKLYLDRVLGPVREMIGEDELRDAPKEVIEWLRRKT